MDFATNYSPRTVYKYKSGGAIHSQLVRLPRGSEVDPDDNSAKLANVWQALKDYLFQDFAVLSATHYPQDSLIGVPISLSAFDVVTPAVNVSGIKLPHKSIQLRFEARGNAGGHGSLSFFGLNVIDVDGTVGYNDFRIYPAENTGVADASTAISETGPQWVPLGSTTSIWSIYANLKFNDYWVKRSRG